MKKILFAIGILCVLVPSASAGVEQCQTAWSDGFDATTKYMLENETNGLALIMTQNDIHPESMWSIYRSLSLEHSCSLRAICAVVEENASDAVLDLVFAQSNTLGGSIPGLDAACPAGNTPRDIFQKIQEYSDTFSTESMQTQCGFEDDSTQSGEYFYMYDLCGRHADLTQEVFDRTLEESILGDNDRKVIGRLSAKVIALNKQLVELQGRSQKMVTLMNSFFAQACVLKNPD